jgi:hypothetical protein
MVVPSQKMQPFSGLLGEAQFLAVVGICFLIVGALIKKIPAVLNSPIVSSSAVRRHGIAGPDFDVIPE